MSALIRREIPLSAFGNGILHNGDQLTQPEFHRLYEQMPEDAKFELVGGIVYMASPARYSHGEYHVQLSVPLAIYTSATPGTCTADNITTILGKHSEPQPDLLLWIEPEFGGQTRYDGEYLAGAPELVLEIAYSS